MYLVKYTRPADSDEKIPLEAEILMTQLISGTPDYDSKGLPEHNEKLCGAANKVNTDCSYTYHGSIAPTPTSPGGNLHAPYPTRHRCHRLSIAVITGCL